MEKQGIKGTVKFFGTPAEETLVGKPVLDEALIEAKVLRHGRGKKIRIYTYKRRKGGPELNQEKKREPL